MGVQVIGILSAMIWHEIFIGTIVCVILLRNDKILFVKRDID